MGTMGQSITLANSIIGVGILAMPFCFQQCGVLLATSILLFMGLVSRLCCYFLLKSALLSRRRNFEFLESLDLSFRTLYAFHVFGSAGKLVVEVGIIGFLMGTCIAYFVVVGDLGPQIIAKMFNINQSDILRTSIMVVVSLVCVLPLGLLRNVDSLSNVSAATIGFYFCLVIKVISEAASQLMTGSWQGRVVLWRPAGLLQCVPIFSMALFCQTQLFEIFESLPSLSLEKMNVVSKNAINICAGVYFTLGLFGYIAFCAQNISGNILMSLSETMASDVIKLGFVMSLAFSFPLIIFPCRASLYSLLYKKVHSSHHDHIINHSIPERSFRCITVAIIAVSLFISLLIPNIELVLGLLGSTIGVLICVVFPAACFINVTFKNTNERILAKGVLVLGIVIMVLGTYANLHAADMHGVRYDDRMTEERIDKIVEDFFHNQQESDSVSNIKSNVIKEAVPVKQEAYEVKIADDSVVQPPNPLPPDSNSNDKQLKTKVSQNRDDIEPKKATIDKSRETHPKKLSSKLHESKAIIENKVSENNHEKVAPKETSLQEKVREQLDFMKKKQLIETIMEHGKEQKELLKEQNEILDKIKKTKNEQVEEEAIQEAKKKAVESIQKIIAVESIQKIANMAIQSLGGVSDKTGDKNKISKNKLEPLKAIANEAVEEIAKQAVETIQLIKENTDTQASKEKKLGIDTINIPNLKQSDDNVMNKIEAIAIVPVQNIKPMEIINNDNAQPDNVKIIPNVKSIPVAQNIVGSPAKAETITRNNNIAQNVSINNENQFNIDNPQPIQMVDQNIQLDKKPKEDGEVPVRNILSAQNDNVQNKLNKNRKDNNEQVPQSPMNKQLPNVQNIENKIKSESKLDTDQAISNAQAPLSNKIDSDAQIQANENGLIPENKAKKSVPVNQINLEHSHSPDEPKSYKQGEELQNNIADSSMKQNIANNIPLALAMNGNNQINLNQQNLNAQLKEHKNGKIDKDETNAQSDNLALNFISHGDVKNIVKPVGPRQKREVIDCTDKTALQPGDKAICEKLVTSSSDTLVQLSSKVDLNKVAFSNKLPVEMIHHIRSLKSYEETDVKR